MSSSDTLQAAAKILGLKFIGQHAIELAKEAERQQQTHLAFLLDLLIQEQALRGESRCKRRVKEAKFPRLKTLDGFDFGRASHLDETRIRLLTEGAYIDKAEPVIFMGEPGTGKTHLAISLGFAAAMQSKAVRFISACQLVNLLVEARDHRELTRLTDQYLRYQLLIIDELGYLPFGKSESELLFQLLSKRHELKPVIITTNLPFSEWTNIFPDSRLCRALIDRITHHAHIIETGVDSIRFEDTLAKHQKEEKTKSKKGGVE